MSLSRKTIIPFIISTISILTASTITVNGGISELNLVQSDEVTLNCSVELGDLELQPISTNEGEFTRISLEGYHRSLIVGDPELPELHQLISIPYDAVPRIEIISDHYTDYTLSDMGITVPLYPAQASLSKSQNPEDLHFAQNKQVYALNSFLERDEVSVEINGFLRGVRIANLIIRPVEYNPVAGLVRIHSELDLRVHFDNADIQGTEEASARLYSPVFEPIYSMLPNYDPAQSRTDLVGNPITFVIVANSMFEGQLDAFIDWKTQQGYTVITGYTNEVGSSTSAIKAFIQDLYENPAEGVAAPSFVLFVGDVAQLPTWNGNTGGHVTDSKYCEFTNDYMPEIYFGRFSAANTSQLQAILDKTLEYEQYTMPDPSYLGEVVMIAGMDSSHGATWGNGQINYGTSNYFNDSHGIYSYTYLWPNSGSNSGNIVTNISEGVGYANYTAHGSQTSWADPSFTISNINSLQNQDEYPLVVGNCCLTNAFDTGTCFGEAWLRAENKGAIGYIGGSNNTYWDEDYWWGVGSGSVVSNPTYGSTGPGAYDGVFHDHGEAESEWYVTSYAMIMAGNLAVVQAGGNMNYYWEIYQLMGDPSLSAYMGVPTDNTVDYIPILQIGLDTFTITAEPYSYVGLAMDGVLYGAGQVDESGALELTIEPIMTAGTATVTVTKQNRVPFVGALEVGNAEGPYIVMEDLLVISDSNGNGDIDYGESIQATLCAQNLGNEAAINVTATVLCDAPYIILTDASASFGDIEPEAIAFSSDGISFDVSNQTPDGHPVVLTVDFSSNTDSWSSNFSFTVNAYCVTGDVNADWEINVLDVIRAVNIILHSGDDPTELELCSADTNGDGIINILDVIGMINIIVGN